MKNFNGSVFYAAKILRGEALVALLKEKADFGILQEQVRMCIVVLSDIINRKSK